MYTQNDEDSVGNLSGAVDDDTTDFLVGEADTSSVDVASMNVGNSVGLTLGNQVVSMAKHSSHH